MSYSFSEEHARFAAPFICKMYFYAPERGNNIIQKKNAEHISYIGKRPGVDLGEEERPLSQGEFDLTDEIKSWEENTSLIETAAGHVKYIDERPRSFGLFSWSDEKPDLKSVQRELLNHKGIVWRSVLSLTEEDATRLGFIERTKWENSLRATVPDVAAKMGIAETNLKWVAAFHEEKGHPHVHLVMWEKKPTRRKGAVHPKLLEDIKRTFAKEIYAEERMQLNQEKTAMRELIRGMGKDELGNIVEIMREMKDVEQQVDLENKSMGLGKVGVTPRLYKDDQLEMVNRIKIIADMLPDRGRIAYQYMPQEVKLFVTDLSKWLLQQPAFNDSLRRYYTAVDNLTRQYSFKESDLEKARINAEADLEKRLSQVILRAAAESKKTNYLILSPEKAQEAIGQFTKAVGRPENNYEEKVMQHTIRALKMIGLSEIQIRELVINWNSNAELNLPSQVINSLITRPDALYKADEKSILLAASAMRLAGLKDEQIKPLMKTISLSNSQIESILKKSERFSKDAATRNITEKDWKRLNQLLGINIKYPWEMRREQVVGTTDITKILESFRNGIVQSTTESKGYIAYCMTTALKKLGISEDDRAETMMGFAQNNGISSREIERTLKSVNERESNFLKNETWQKITDSLSIDHDYPFVVRETLELNPAHFNQAIQTVSESTSRVIDPKDAEWIASKLINLLSNHSDDERNIRNFIEEWANKTGSMSSDDVSKLNINLKRTDDINILGKQIGLRDEIADTIHNVAKVMFAAGLKEHQINQVVMEWSQRTGLQLDTGRISKLIGNVANQANDLKLWGRAPTLSRNEFNKLNYTLQTDAPYPWEKRHGKGQYKEPNMNIAKKLWNSVWNSLEKERVRSHAQGEIMQKQNMHRLERESQQDKER